MAKNIPTVFVVFGATGDLMSKKIIPALFHLYEKNKLPLMFRLIGFARRPLTQEQFQRYCKDMLRSHGEEDMKKVDEFLRSCLYQQGNFTHKDDYVKLATVMGRIDGEWKVCSNKLFYLAVPPHYYSGIFNHLASSGLTLPCGPDEGWTRVLVEKPFGKDLETAEDLDLLLAKLFKEEQIYRIDHYLAKEMLQNILLFRFSNNLLEPSWNNKFIEKIEIKLHEKIGVESRGVFYDGLGTLRDVGQNHLLQMLALITMEAPMKFDSESVRPSRATVLHTLQKMSNEEVKKYTFRAQYKEYTRIKGVLPQSTTETYFKLKTYLNHPRWEGVPIFMESGKRLKKQVKEITVTFKHVLPCECLTDEMHTYRNKVIFQLEPHERIQVGFISKKPGLDLQVQETMLGFNYRSKKKRRQYVEEYEKLLLDCIVGNQLLFLSTDEVKAMWRFTDPISSVWNKNNVSLHVYKPDSNSFIKKAEYIYDANKTGILTAKEVVIVGLGKMGGNIARQLIRKGWNIYGYNRTKEDTQELEKVGLKGIYEITDIKEKITNPRIIWMMVPAGPVFDELVFGKKGLVEVLDKGDIVVDAGNSFYKDSIRRGKLLSQKGIRFLDIGVSGGPMGALNGASLMVGGTKDLYEYLKPLLTDIAVPEGVQFFEGVGAGHFIKMIHNGIEYGMMQAIAEGFAILKKSHYSLDLKNISHVYNHGSVVESKLMSWLITAFEIYSDELKNVSGSVAHTGEGKWTVETAEELGVKVKIIEESFKFRVASEKNPSYTGKILSALRNQFGGHSIK
ncbi:MAG: glucose-6-phosphate dehydrogenase [bacterium]|nr:glucose-6-phosphate dehydrogenase [bacterium]